MDNKAALYARTRHAPTLTRAQFIMLQNRPYEYPQRVAPEHRRAALVLKREGLLEEDPGSRGVFRCTDAGMDVVRRWEAAGWR